MTVTAGKAESRITSVGTDDDGDLFALAPTDLSELKIIPGQDLCTLVTCTPFGINTHRLLVRGHRIEYKNTAVSREESQLTESALIIVLLGMVLIVVCILAVMTVRRFCRDKAQR